MNAEEKKVLFTELALPVGSPDLAFLGVSIEGIWFMKKIIILILL